MGIRLMNMTTSTKNLIQYKNISVVIAAILLVLALASWPYGYYIFLRWTVAVAAGLLAYTAYTLQKTAWVVIGVTLLILWNPIAPVHLDRSTWSVLDIVAAVLFGTAWFVVRSSR